MKIITERQIRELEIICQGPQNVAVSTGMLKEMIDEIKEYRSMQVKMKEYAAEAEKRKSATINLDTRLKVMADVEGMTIEKYIEKVLNTHIAVYNVNMQKTLESMAREDEEYRQMYPEKEG